MASKDCINGGEHALAQVRGQLRADALIADAKGDRAKARILWDAASEFTSAWWTEIRHEQALEAGERQAAVDAEQAGREGDLRPCGRGICAALDGHPGTCAEASGWDDTDEEGDE